MQRVRPHIGLLALAGLYPILLTSTTQANINAVWGQVHNQGNWSDAAKWSTNPVIPDNTPTDKFDVRIGFYDPYTTIELDSDRTVENLFIQGPVIRSTSGKTLNVVNTLTLESCKLGSGISVLVQGHLQASNSTIMPQARLTIAAGATADITSAIINGDLDQYGSMAFRGNSYATFPGSNAINNHGSLTLSSTSSGSFITAKLNNTGEVVVDSGWVALQGGGTSTGTFNIKEGATLSFDVATGSPGAVFDIGNAKFTGGGELLIATTQSMTFNNYSFPGVTFVAGSAIFAGNSTPGKLALNGNVSGTGAIHVTKELILYAGALEGSGTVYIDAGATLTTSNASIYGPLSYLNRPLVNNGTATLPAYTLDGTGTFTNNGTLRTSGVSRMASIVNSATGLLSVDSGYLQIVAPTEFTNSGTTNVLAGATLTVGAPRFTNKSRITLDPSSTLEISTDTASNTSAGEIRANQATISLSGGGWTNSGKVYLTDSVLRVAGQATVSGLGTIINTGNSKIEITGRLYNGPGIFAVTPGLGPVELKGGEITGGTVRVDVGGSLSGYYGKVTGTLENHGTLSATNVFVGSNLLLANDSILRFPLLGGINTFLSENGTTQLTLDGKLEIQIPLAMLPNLTFASSFELIRSNQVLLGEFDNAPDGSRITSIDGTGSFIVTYGGTNTLTITGFQAVPEPGTPFLLAASMGLIGSWRRRPMSRR